ncbi:MAG TPA: metallophosphoesterase [Steroidobacteraceae bacterium]|nr:metallophosphoesterase [Steroidobacteraceae bacterium]
MRATTTLILLLLSCAAVTAAPDGPYVFRKGADAWESLAVDGKEGQEKKRVTTLAHDASITVKAVGAVPAFKVRLRGAAMSSPDEIRIAAATPLFVVADTHGEYEILVSMLQKQRIVGKKLEWKFGRGHLVLLGDVFDRGPNHTEILWLLYQLEAEAARAGGGVHLLLGNHEAMVMMGDLRYLNPKYVQTAAVLGVSAYSQLFDSTSVLGQWLRSLPTVLKINDLLCLHAGLSRVLIDSQMSLPEINAGVRSVLGGSGVDARPERDSLLMGSAGPLWYRGYFADQKNFPTATMGDIDHTLKTFGVRKILVGHTIVPAITPLFDGKVIAVQVYPRREDSGQVNFESLLIKGGESWRVKLDGTRVAL